MGSKSDSSFWRRTLKNSASGTVAGMAVCLVGHPFDTLKVRLQTQPVESPLYSGLLDCFLKTCKNEGLGGLYKGVGSPMAGQMFFRAIMFTSYYQIYTYIAGEARKGQRLKTYEYFICGAFTGTVSSFIEGPIDLFKTKMQIQVLRAHTGVGLSPYRNVFEAGWLIGSRYGLRGVYQGLPATLLRNTPACAFYFGFFEICRDLFTPPGGSVDQLPVRALLVAGGTGGFLYWFLTYPADVIKSTLQADESEVKHRRFRGILHCARCLYTEEGGWRRFYRGFSPCLMRSVLANAVMLSVLEKTRQFLS